MLKIEGLEAGQVGQSRIELSDEVPFAEPNNGFVTLEAAPSRRLCQARLRIDTNDSKVVREAYVSNQTKAMEFEAGGLKFAGRFRIASFKFGTLPDGTISYVEVLLGADGAFMVSTIPTVG